ncbi:hypothetical protein [Microbacterium aurum]|nr:hypothetical protein [Microbacterium aurum]MCG7414405.1 hypothetical protein [Microbacterium aurum]
MSNPGEAGRSAHVFRSDPTDRADGRARTDGVTLTDIVPTLRRTLPVPLRARAWPDHTTPTTTDVVVAGVSMRRLAEMCGTPCVHNTDRIIRTNPRQAEVLRSDVSVVITRVVMTVNNLDSQRVILIDANFSDVPAVWSEARLIDRISAAASAPGILLAAEAAAPAYPSPPVRLPADLAEGDLLALPCEGTVPLGRVRPVPLPRHDTAPLSPAIAVSPAIDIAPGLLSALTPQL